MIRIGGEEFLWAELEIDGYQYRSPAMAKNFSAGRPSAALIAVAPDNGALHSEIVRGSRSNSLWRPDYLWLSGVAGNACYRPG